MFGELKKALDEEFDDGTISFDEYATRRAAILREEKIASRTYVVPGAMVEIVCAKSPAYEVYVGMRGKVIAIEGDILPVIVEFEDCSWDVFQYEECRTV